MSATLRGRMMLAMVIFATATSVVMVLMVVAFAYGIEDAGFNAQLDRELARQQVAIAAGRPVPAPNDPAMRRVTADGLPEGLAAVLVEEPGRVEFTAPTGRHYHFRASATEGPDPVWLLFDVTDRLIVRPSATAIWILLATTTLAVLLAGVGLALLLSRLVTQPLSALVQAVQQTAPGTLELRVPIAVGPTEVKVLATHLESLVARLQAFVGREQAFTRDASHEIRTPLAVMRLQLDQLLTLSEVSPAARVLLVGLHDAVDNLQRIVETLLWLAREEVRPSVVDAVALRPIVERAIVDQSLRLERRDLAIDIDVPDQARLVAPRGALVLLVGNVLGNALAHAAPGQISIRWDGTALVIRNSRFSATEIVEAADDGHAGFGLSILQRVAERSGLAVTIDATGAYFDVRLGPAAVVGPSHV